MYWKIVFYHDKDGKTSVIVGPFTDVKQRDDFRKYWRKELMSPEYCRGYYYKVRFVSCNKIAKNSLPHPPKDFRGIPEFFRFIIKRQLDNLQ